MNNELTHKLSAGNYRYLILQTVARICQNSTVHSARLSVAEWTVYTKQKTPPHVECYLA